MSYSNAKRTAVNRRWLGTASLGRSRPNLHILGIWRLWQTNLMSFSPLWAQRRRLTLLPYYSDFNDFELFSAQQLYPDSEQFQFCAVSMREIRKIVMSFPSHKAPGCDKVPIQIIKDALPCILPILTDILNHSLLSPVFPQDWKISEIIPLLKEGDHEVANNKGPISLLPAASKVCERVALIHFTQFMKAEKHLTEHQSSNKAMHSTETMKVMTDQMLQVIDGKKLSIRQYRPQ